MAYAKLTDIPAKLDLQETARVAQDTSDATVVLDRPVDIWPGSVLAVGYPAPLQEIVTVQDVEGQMFTVTPAFSRVHKAGEKVIDLTIFQSYLEAASHLVDAYTWGSPGWLAYGEVTETLWGIADRDGNIALPVTKRPVKEVLSFEYQSSPRDPSWKAIEQNIWFEDDDYWIHAYPEVAGTVGRRVRCRVTYRGGYTLEEMPAGIRHATAALAARLWKEKDSGFADVIGSPDIGMMEYKKAIPSDLREILKVWRRVAV